MIEQLKLPQDVALDIAGREKKIRRSKKITQKEMSEKIGISLGSVKRFEKTGEISFVALIKIAFVLNDVSAFEELFTRREYHSIQEVIDENS
ncbi:MAG: helix-turn-helix transcriptional regulator [Clostridiales bacterium]|jgi:transcriptional regulator with XRE-family HTH domain|nr:helix-turn-helix transcriptional regulator [Clostridiales bacterium]